MNVSTIDRILARLHPHESSDWSLMPLSRTFERKERVYEVGDPVLHVYLVRSGRVKLGSVSEDGRALIKAILGPGDLFGTMALVGDEAQRNFAEAMDDRLEVIEIPVEDWLQEVERDPALAEFVRGQLGARLRQTDDRLDALVFKDARTRIVDFLLDLAAGAQPDGGRGIRIPNMLTHQDIASLTATSRQTVTSILNELREEGKIWFDRKEMRIIDLPERVLN